MFEVVNVFTEASLRYNRVMFEVVNVFTEASLLWYCIVLYGVLFMLGLIQRRRYK